MINHCLVKTLFTLQLLLQVNSINSTSSYSPSLNITSGYFNYIYSPDGNNKDFYQTFANSDDERKPAAKKQKRRSDSEESEDQDEDEIIDLNEDELKLVLDSLPSQYIKKITKPGWRTSKGPGGCTFPSTRDIQRSDNVVLSHDKITRMINNALSSNQNLNLVPNPINPNQRLFVTIDPATELVVGVGIESLYKYLGRTEVLLHAADRFDYRRTVGGNAGKELSYITQRGFYYTQEKKHIDDPGLYFDQDESDLHIKRAANSLCIPRIAMGYHSDITGYMMGPEGVSIIRDEYNPGTYMHRWDLWKENSDRGVRYPISEEWIKEFNRIVPLRRIIGIEKVKCMVFVEDERKYCMYVELLFVYILSILIHPSLLQNHILI